MPTQASSAHPPLLSITTGLALSTVAVIVVSALYGGWSHVLVAYDLPQPYPNAVCAETLVPVGSIVYVLMSFGPFLVFCQPRWCVQFFAVMAVVAITLWGSCTLGSESFQEKYYALHASDPSVVAFNKGFCTAKYDMACMSPVDNTTRRGAEELALVWTQRGCASDNGLNASVLASLETSLCQSPRWRVASALKTEQPAFTDVSREDQMLCTRSNMVAMRWCVGLASLTDDHTNGVTSPLEAFRSHELRDAFNKWGFVVSYFTWSMFIVTLVALGCIIQLNMACDLNKAGWREIK
ncbi:hypothetical protein Poli38472_014681 [Pythium oligandrum]|uniref:Uncharacterized protein n=1 Tax=Pythium oligandrum TaxID=41045 RepID=A0A8K1FIM3_PYTOL|nr:hypothetical protein Poli38472_014681 [Pythium oligandrum]|eukprot:TMW63976.1 hypothetical protein Poli38472_014681 [Pythium oligandrum]